MHPDTRQMKLRITIANKGSLYGSATSTWILLLHRMLNGWLFSQRYHTQSWTSLHTRDEIKGRRDEMQSCQSTREAAMAEASAQSLLGTNKESRPKKSNARQLWHAGRVIHQAAATDRGVLYEHSVTRAYMIETHTGFPMHGFLGRSRPAWQGERAACNNEVLMLTRRAAPALRSPCRPRRRRGYRPGC